MSVTKNENVVILTAAEDELAFPVRVKCIRWVAGASSEAGDEVVLTEASIGTVTDELWRSVAAGSNYIEADSAGGGGFEFRNGVRVDVIDVGSLFLYLW